MEEIKKVSDRIFSHTFRRNSYILDGTEDGCTWLAPPAAILRWIQGRTCCSSTFFHAPFVVLIIVITSGRPFAHVLFLFFLHPLASLGAPFLPPWPPYPCDRFRSGQLHFFLGRGRNKTMIRIGIAPVPHLPRIGVTSKESARLQ